MDSVELNSPLFQGRLLFIGVRSEISTTRLVKCDKDIKFLFFSGAFDFYLRESSLDPKFFKVVCFKVVYSFSVFYMCFFWFHSWYRGFVHFSFNHSIFYLDSYLVSLVLPFMPSNFPNSPPDYFKFCII